MQNPFGDNVSDHNYLIHLDICKISFVDKDTVEGKENVYLLSVKPD